MLASSGSVSQSVDESVPLLLEERRRASHPRPGNIGYLHGDGVIRDREGNAIPAQGLHLLVLARELCRFHHFEAVPEARRSQTDAAAELFWEVHAPYLETDSLKVRTAHGVAIWSWDWGKVRDVLNGRALRLKEHIVPESLVHARSEGWVQRRTLAGYEAQCWIDGMIVASSWRRRPFDEAQWQTFTSETGIVEPIAPDLPPAPEVLEIPETVVALPKRIRPQWRWRQIEKAAVLMIITAAAFGSYQFGQAAAYEDSAAADLAALENLEGTVSLSSAEAQLRSDIELARSYARFADQSAALPAAAEAFRILGDYELPVLEWSIDEDRFEAHISPAPPLVVLRDAAAVMEEHPAFKNVAARTDHASGTLIMQADLHGSRSPAAQAPSPEPRTTNQPDPIPL